MDVWTIVLNEYLKRCRAAWETKKKHDCEKSSDFIVRESFFFINFAVGNDFRRLQMNFFRKIFKYIDDLDYGVFHLRLLMIVSVVMIGYGAITSRIPVKAALLFGLFVIVICFMAEYVGKSVRRKIKRKKDLEDLKTFKRFKYD